MTKLIVFKLDGNFTEGFSVNVEIFPENRGIHGRITGALPPEPQLIKCLQLWQQEYRKLGSDSTKRIKGKKVIFTSSSLRSQLQSWGKQLKTRFQKWLRAESFQEVNFWLREKLDPQESIEMLICTNNQQVHQLPWNQWDFLQTYQSVEIALSSLDVIPIPSTVRRYKSQVRILAIFGSSHQINVRQDLNILEKLENTYLEPLIEPQRHELHDRLWSDSWDIVFFAGHSETIQGEGIIYLNDRDILKIQDLEYAFQRAIANGLQLAIFNSCEGLGLADALHKLALPQIIVMREPIIDCVAHQFLTHFITEYSSGEPLHLATRKARERLQGWEDKYPYSSWLPVLFQNQSATPLLWSQLFTTNQKFTTKIQQNRNYLNLALVNAIAFILIWCLQTMGWLQTGELKNFDRALSLRPPEARDERILAISVDDEDIDYQTEKGMVMRGSLSDMALLELLNKLQLYQPAAIASDIIHDFAYTPELERVINNRDDFLAICRVENDLPKIKISTIKPPPGIDMEQTGFTNMAIDPDGVIRRHLLGMSPDRQCQTDISLSLRVALKYLDRVAAKENQGVRYPRQFTEDGLLKIGTTIFPKIASDSGAYQLPKTENLSYQLLLNYRANEPQTISLRDILTETSTQKLAKLIKNKIIFIGVKSHNNDLHYTPYSREQQSARVSGVLVHAQGTSQIISAVLDGRQPLKWFDNKLESLWTFIWVLIGSGIVLLWDIFATKNRHSALIIFIAIFSNLILLYLSYFGLIWVGYWLPLIAPTLGIIFGAVGSLFLLQQANFSEKKKF